MCCVQHILLVRVILHHGACDPVESAVVLLHDRAKRRLIAALCTLDQVTLADREGVVASFYCRLGHDIISSAAAFVQMGTTPQPDCSEKFLTGLRIVSECAQHPARYHADTATIHTSRRYAFVH